MLHSGVVAYSVSCVATHMPEGLKGADRHPLDFRACVATRVSVSGFDNSLYWLWALVSFVSDSWLSVSPVVGCIRCFVI